MPFPSPGVFAVSVSDNCSVRFRSPEPLLPSACAAAVFLFVLFCLLVFMVFFFDLCCSVSDSRPSPPEARASGRPVGVVFRGHHAPGPLMKARAGEGESLKPPCSSRKKDLKTQSIGQDKQTGAVRLGQFAEDPRRFFISNEVS